MNENMINQNQKISFTIKLAVFLSVSLLFLLPVMKASLLVSEFAGAPNIFSPVIAAFLTSIFVGFCYYFISKMLPEIYQLAALVMPLVVLLFFLPSTQIYDFNIDTTNYPALLAFKIFLFDFGAFIVFLFAVLLKVIDLFQQNYKEKKNDYYSYMITVFTGSVFCSFLIYFLFFEPNFSANIRFKLWNCLYIISVYLIFASVFLKYYKEGKTFEDIKNLFKNRCIEKLSIEIKKDDALDLLGVSLLSFIPTAIAISTISTLSTIMTVSTSIWFVVILSALLGIKLGFCRFTKFFRNIAYYLHLPIIVTFFIINVVFSINNVLTFLLILSIPFVVFTMASYEIKLQIKDGNVRNKFIALLLGALTAGLFFGICSFGFIKNYYEYQLLLTFSILLRSNLKIEGEEERQDLIKFMFSLMLCLLIWFLSYKYASGEQIKLILVFLLGTLYLYNNKVLKLFLALFVVFTLSQSIPSKEKIITEKCNFYGCYKITKTKNNFFYLYRGTQLKAVQFRDDELEEQPSNSATKTTPVGQIFETFKNVDNKWNVGVIGIGSGALLEYAKPEQNWTIFEPDKALVNDIKSGDTFTHFVNYKHNNVEIISGDPLKAIMASDKKFDFIILNDYVTNGLPAYLFATNSIKKYFKSMNKTGIILFNYSNKILNYGVLFPKQARGAMSLGVSQIWLSPSVDNDGLKTVTEWGALSRNINIVETIVANGKWFMMEESGRLFAWNSSYDDILPIIRDFKDKYQKLFFEKPLNVIKTINNKIMDALVAVLAIISIIIHT